MEKAQAAREEAVARRPAVAEAVSQLRAIRRENHFAEKFNQAIKGHAQ